MDFASIRMITDDLEPVVERFNTLVSEWVLEPITMPWGIAPSVPAVIGAQRVGFQKVSS